MRLSTVIDILDELNRDGKLSLKIHDMTNYYPDSNIYLII